MSDSVQSQFWPFQSRPGPELSNGEAVGGITITLTWQELVFSSAIGLRRRIESLRRNLRELNGVDRSTEAHQWYYNIVGACGEYAVAKAICHHWPAEINQGDHPDVMPDIQVRTLARLDYDLLVRKGDRDDFKFVLALGEPPTFKICGWIWGWEAKQEKWLGDKGNRNEPAFWVPQQHLHDLGSI